MRLVALEGPLAGRQVELGPEPLTIGRSPPSSILVDHDEVSREHCRLQCQGEKLVLEDLGSRNGTYLNGRQIQGTSVLRPGDLLVVGPALFEVRGEPAQAPALEAARAPSQSSRPVAAPAPGPASAASDTWVRHVLTLTRASADAGRSVDRRAAALLRLLAASEVNVAGELEREARRLLQLCEQASAGRDPRATVATLSRESAALRRIVDAALQLLGPRPR